MDMNLAQLADEIFDALQEFDRTVQPFGLYSVRDVLLQPKPHEVVRPFRAATKAREDLKSIEAFCLSIADIHCWAKSGIHRFSFAVPSFGSVSLHLLITSKIKVRQYGSRYHLDKHENYTHRWGELQLDEEITKLRSPRANEAWQMLLFLGFDKAQRPFERELSELKAHQTRASHGIEFSQRTWDDSIGRGFKVKAALWAH